ncbi:hypothetical protein [Mycolicibacterium sp.]|uniref:hypothetical protein n=1 Tax=Mycolicibacterium sp. TaxID=2320850 RepID=UPI0025CD5635|nr:hypothetical protein [Mycolicibacterium sp.]
MTRPADVDTGFWLWLTALPLLMIGQISEGFVAEVPGDRKMVVVATTFFTVGLGVIVLTFLLLMRSGYKWTRTLLTAGGVATIVYTAVTLLGVVRDPIPAAIYAVTGIIGSVLIGGGIYLLHRPDSHAFFTR